MDRPMGQVRQLDTRINEKGYLRLMTEHPRAMNMSNTLDNSVSVSEHHEEKKKTLAAGKRFYFDVEAAEHMLGLLYPETRDILYPVEGKTCIVFNIPPDINNLKVECSNQLRGKTEATSENGVNVLSLELDANVLKEYIAIVDNAQQQLIEKNNAFNALRAEINAKASDPKYDIDAAEAREKAVSQETQE